MSSVTCQQYGSEGGERNADAELAAEVTYRVVNA